MTAADRTANGSRVRMSTFTRQVALIVSATFFIEQLDTTIITTAIPDIARALHTDALSLNLAMTAYMLGLAIVVPLSGRLADRYGTRHVFAAATGLFLAASLLCGLATGPTFLVIARFIQGVGGALMTPVGRLIVVRTAQRSELVEAMALVLMPAMVAPLLGPAVGGLIVTWLSWRWIFLVNVPLGLLAIAIIVWILPNERSDATRGLDLFGSSLVGASFACAALACESLGGHGLGLLGAGILAICGAGFCTLYMRHARRHKTAVIDLDLLKLPNFRNAMISGSVYRVAVGGVPFLLPLALQIGHGIPALTSGFIVLVPAIGGLAMKFFSTPLLRYHGYRTSFLLHGTLSAVFLAMLAIRGVWDAWWLVALLLVAFGLSRSLLMNAFGTIAYAEVPRERTASATSFFLAMQNLSTGMGVGFAALAASAMKSALPRSDPATQFALAFGVLGACAAVSVALSLFFEPDAGHELIRTRRA